MRSGWVSRSCPRFARVDAAVVMKRLPNFVGCATGGNIVGAQTITVDLVDHRAPVCIHQTPVEILLCLVDDRLSRACLTIGGFVAFVRKAGGRTRGRLWDRLAAAMRRLVNVVAVPRRRRW